MSAGPVPTDDLLRWQRGALVAGGAGLAACAVAALVPASRAEFFRSYLVAYLLVLGVALGSLAVVMMQYLTGGAWGFVLRRPLEAGTRTLPLLAVLFLPLALGAGYLYVWADPAQVAADENLAHKYRYLNLPWFFVRAGVYFAVWVGLALLLNAWSARQDQARDTKALERCQALSGPGLVLFALTVTFAAIDWVMSLEPHWYSTIYGGMFGMGQVLSGFAFGVAVFLLLGTRPPLDAVVGAQNLRALGSLLLAFVMVWAYLSFSQFLIIWSGNLPEEVVWYTARLEGGWRYAALALVLLHFALPFALLLSGDMKRDRRRLAAVCLLVLGMRFVDLLWLVAPAFRHGHGPSHGGHLKPALAAPLYLAALVGVGGLWLGAFLWQVRRRPLLPAPAPEEANHHG